MPTTVALRLVLAVLAIATPACPVAESKGPSSGEAATPPPAQVQVAAARDGGLDDEWVFLGEARATQRAELAASADGEVLEVAVRVGDRVQAGDLLVRIDGSLARARVAAAAASRTENHQEWQQAKRDRERAESLGGTIIAEAEIERDVTRATTLQSRSARLQAAEREAKTQLSRHRVTAPFAGVIAARHVDPGDWVSPGDRVLDLVDDASVEIIVEGSAELVRRLERGATAKLVEARDDGEPATVDAEIAGLVRALDPVTRTAKVRLVPKVAAPWLLPGASVSVAFAIHRGESGVVVPRDALVHGPVDVRVIRVQGDKAAPITVVVVATAGAEALVRGEGLSVGDNVVVRGNERLRPGQAVVVVH